MSSKRARRKKRRENFDPDLEVTPYVKPDDTEQHEYIKTPGQTYVRTGGLFLLIGGLLSAIVVFFAINNLRDITPEELIAYTAADGMTPLGYSIDVALRSVAGVFQLIFGFQIFRYGRDPFYWKTTMIMAITLIVVELVCNLITIFMSTSAFNITMLFYGTIFPLVILYGAYRNRKFAKEHPGYIPPEPTQMF